MFILDNKMLDGLCRQAENSSRRRKHLNIHSSYQENSDRLFDGTQRQLPREVGLFKRIIVA